MTPSRLLCLTALAFLLCCFPRTARTQTWQPLGPDYRNQASFGSAWPPLAATGQNGATYLFFQSNTNVYGSLQVRRFTGPGWTDLPAPADSAFGLAATPGFLVDATQAPCLVFERTATFHFQVVRFNGSSWDRLHGPAGIPGRFPSMTMDKAGRLVVAYMDPVNGARLTVIRYNGASWDTLGQRGFSPPVQQVPKIAIGAGNRPYVACRETNTDQLHVFSFDGNHWWPVTPPGLPGPFTAPFSLSTDTAGAPWLSYTDTPNVHILRYDGNYWNPVGDSIPVASPYVFLNQLAFSPANEPYCLISFWDDIRLYKWSGTGWDSLHVPYERDTRPMSFGITPAGEPLYAGYNYTNSGKASVRKLGPSGWQRLGDLNFSAGNTTGIVVAPDYHGGVFAAYVDSTDIFDPKTVVQHYDGSSWQQTGPGLSGIGLPTRHRLVTDTSGTPYLLHETVSNYPNAPNVKVYRFDGTDWVQLLQLNGSNHDFRSDLAVSHSGALYLLYKAAVVGLSRIAVGVKKWQGSTGWQQVADTFHSYPGEHHIGVSPAGKIYIQRSDQYRELRVVTLAADSTWQNVGPAGSFRWPYSRADLAISASGVPLVGYKEDPNIGPLYIYRFNGQSWDSLGAPGIPSQSPMSFELESDAVGTPYVAYLEPDSTNPARWHPSLTRFNGGAWEPIGQPDFVGTGVSAFSLAIDGTYAYAGFNALGAFAKRLLLPPAPLRVPAVRSAAPPDFLLYPNPVSGRLTFELRGPAAGGGEIVITDMAGRVLLTRPCRDRIAHLDVSGLPGGTYLLRYSHAGGQSAALFIKDGR